MKIRKEFLIKTKKFLKELSDKSLRQKVLKTEIKIINSKLNYFKSNKISSLLQSLNQKKIELENLNLYIESNLIYIDFLEDYLRDIILKRYFNIFEYGKLISYSKLAYELNISESTAKRYISKGIKDLSYIMYGDIIFEQ
ncbi:hypothetical protein [Paraclostridium sordellii]|uniref:Uncharacterized protein n=1 Tax=Paraclostridium sordellii TaxID=1505 RepID=A0A9P1KWR9_PARSO|nr:hypothetical protein [Paeniclostridium sordellii]CEN31431.1 Uncharacterised protein [[Clostridium] sordellii] [Paeniclostridium sordellii]